MDDDRATVLPFPQAPEAIELRHMRAFVTVAEELSFSRAAERLYISPSALSRQIRALERLVGCDLLERSTHSVELTLAGDALLERAREVLRDVDAAVQMAQSVGGELVGRVARLWEPVDDVFATEATIDELREAFEALQAQFSPPPDIDVRPVNAGGVPSLLVAPKAGVEPAILYLHGGGYVLGSAFGYRHLAGAIASAAGATVLVPDYRLAPEHPFPAALEDALRAYEWMLGRESDVAVAGDSAGAGLTISLLLTLKERGLPMPRSAALLCPAVDLSWTTVRPLGPVSPGRGQRGAPPALHGSVPRGASHRRPDRQPAVGGPRRAPADAHPGGDGRHAARPRPPARRARPQLRRRGASRALPDGDARLPVLLVVPARGGRRRPAGRPLLVTPGG